MPQSHTLCLKPNQRREPSDKLQVLLFAAQFVEARDYVLSILDSELKQPIDFVKAEETFRSLRLRCMMAEILDYWGQYKLARRVIKTVSAQCEAAVEVMEDGAGELPRTDAERKLIRQQVWVLLHAGMTDYRRGTLGHAAYLFAAAERVCLKHVVTSVDPAWGTRARIYYCLALIDRERLEYGPALARFTTSVNCGYNSLQAHPGELSKFSYITIAKSLALGLAFVHNAMGRPDLAYPLLVAAKTMLQPISEKLLSCYVDLLYANVLRGMEGARGGAALDDVIIRLQQCYASFRELRHVPYQARAAYHLAIAHLQRARPDETVPLSRLSETDVEMADAYAEELRRFAFESRDVRAEMRRQVLKSRIARKRDHVQDAEEAATKAIQAGLAIQEPITDALIARGKARARMGKFEEAVQDFEQGLKGDNPRTRAVCLLYLCQLYCGAQRYSEASRYFAEFERMKSEVTNLQVITVERTARAALQRSDRDLVLRIADAGLTAKSVDARVRRFLANWARARVQTDSEAARLLEVSRQTFYNWLANIDDPNGSKKN